MSATVRARLLRLAALLLLPGLAIAALLTWQVFMTARNGAETALRGAASSLDQLVDREFAQAELLLRILAATGELQRGDLGGVRPPGRARQSSWTAPSFWWTGPARSWLTPSILPAFPCRGVTRPGWDGEAVGTRIIEPLAPRPGSTTLWVAVVVPVGTSGRHVYDLKLMLPVTSMQAILTRAALPPGWVSSIMDTSDRLAARSRDPQLYVGRTAGPDLLAGLLKSDEGARDGTAIDGTHVLLAYSRSAQSRWTVAVAAPRRLVAQAGLVSTTLLAAPGHRRRPGGARRAPRGAPGSRALWRHSPRPRIRWARAANGRPSPRPRGDGRGRRRHGSRGGGTLRTSDRAG